MYKSKVCARARRRRGKRGKPSRILTFTLIFDEDTCVFYLSVSKVVQDGGQLFGVAVLTLGPKPGVGIPPVYGEPVEPHLSLLRVKLLQTRVKTVDLTSGAGQGTLQIPILHSQPATQGGGSKI